MIRYEQYERGNELNWYDDDPILKRYAKRYLPERMLASIEVHFSALGRLAAGPIDRRAVHTDREGQPRLVRYDRQGREINEVWYNEGYLQTVRDGYGSGVVSLRYTEQYGEPVPFFANAMLLSLIAEAETGFACPVVLSQSAAFVLEKFGSEEQKREYLSRLAATDPERLYQGATFLTEIQGGSDVGAALTVAVQNGDHYLLTGEKWFASNCDAEVAVILARVNDKPSTAGLGLFLLPRTLPDGRKNNVAIRRLKDKLGVRAVASGELILNQAVAYLIGDAEQGFKYMAEALNVSRIGTAVGALGTARRSFLEAAIYAGRREAFGNKIDRYPMVQETLAQMITEIEAGWAVCAQTLKKFDQVHTYGTAAKEDYLLLRVLLSLAKYRCSEVGVNVAKQALELHGGNGYIEEYPIARMLRDAIVNPVWEGTANVQALEILKNLQKGGWQSFLADLKGTLHSVQHAALSALRDHVATEVERMERAIEQVLRQEARRQSGLAKKLADWMYDVYAAVHLLEEAQHDLKTLGDGRRLLVAEQWVRRVFNRADDRGLLDAAAVLSDEEFASLVAFVPWKVREVLGVKESE